MEAVSGLEGWTPEAFATGHVEVGFVDGGHVDKRGEGTQNLFDFFGVFAVEVEVALDEDGVGAEEARRAERHGGVDAVFAGLVAGGGDDTALVALAANDDGLAFEGRVEELFDGDEEGVHVEVEDGLHGSTAVSRQGRPARSF